LRVWDWLGIASGQEVAQMSDEQMQQLRQNKLVSSAVLNNRYGGAVTFGLGLIGPELWWFLF